MIPKVIWPSRLRCQRDEHQLNRVVFAFSLSPVALTLSALTLSALSLAGCHPGTQRQAPMPQSDPTQINAQNQSMPSPVFENAEDETPGAPESSEAEVVFDFPTSAEPDDEFDSEWLIPLANESVKKESPSQTSTTPSGSARPKVKSETQTLRKITLTRPLKVYRMNNDGVLEQVTELPAGSQISVPEVFRINAFPHREQDGKVVHSSTGFIHPVRIDFVPAPTASTKATKTAAQSTRQNDSPISKEKIADLNSGPRHLHVFASIIQDLEGTSGTFATLATNADLSPGFLKHYEVSGRPKFVFRKTLQRRFGSRVNLAITDLSQDERNKWVRIMTEIQRAVNREQPSPRDLLLIDRREARTHSERFENTGAIHDRGAWSIAVTATARRHGFAAVPCAEFASEVIRQAYRRAGYKVTHDFNSDKNNRLFWTETAAVSGLSSALVKGGWIAWSADEFEPPVGAVMLHGAGQSPGHVFFSAGSSGRWIVDNGSPQGRDLREASSRTIAYLYRTGGFILPPGIIPKRWPDTPSN